jgi:hypothetical protein
VRVHYRDDFGNVWHKVESPFPNERWTRQRAHLMPAWEETTTHQECVTCPDCLATLEWEVEQMVCYGEWQRDDDFGNSRRHTRGKS